MFLTEEEQQMMSMLRNLAQEKERLQVELQEKLAEAQAMEQVSEFPLANL